MEQLNGHDQEAVNGSNNSMTAFFARYRAVYSIYIVKNSLYTGTIEWLNELRVTINPVYKLFFTMYIEQFILYTL